MNTTDTPRILDSSIPSTNERLGPFWGFMSDYLESLDFGLVPSTMVGSIMTGIMAAKTISIEIGKPVEDLTPSDVITFLTRDHNAPILTKHQVGVTSSPPSIAP